MNKKWVFAVFIALVCIRISYSENYSRCFTEKVQYKGDLALTFDDGPSSKYTPILLEELKKREVRATFFLIGENIPGNEKIVRRMFADGHLIGNHSLMHLQLTKEDTRKAYGEIRKVNKMIEDITGAKCQYIRPPFGSWNEKLEELLPQMNVVLWDIDPLDWKVLNSNRVIKHVESKAEPGSIILLHDIYPTSVEAAIKIVDDLKKEGYRFVTIDELFVD